MCCKGGYGCHYVVSVILILEFINSAFSVYDTRSQYDDRATHLQTELDDEGPWDVGNAFMYVILGLWVCVAQAIIFGIMNIYRIYKWREMQLENVSSSSSPMISEKTLAICNMLLQIIISILFTISFYYWSLTSQYIRREGWGDSAPYMTSETVGIWLCNIPYIAYVAFMLCFADHNQSSSTPHSSLML